MSDIHDPSFTFVIDGVEPFKSKAKFYDLIVAAIQLIDADDMRPTRTILAEKFGREWSGEKLKRPLFLLAQGGKLTRVSTIRYVVAR